MQRTPLLLCASHRPYVPSPVIRPYQPVTNPPSIKRGRAVRTRFCARKELLALRGRESAKSRNLRLLDLAAQVFSGTNARKVTWEAAAANVAYRPSEVLLPEFAIVGKRNCGKTSLLKLLLAPSYVHLEKSSAPGNHQMINFFNVNHTLRLVETPGYGFTRETLKTQHRWQNAVMSLVMSRPSLRHIYLLTDVKPSGFTERDKSMVEYLAAQKLSFTQVVTCADVFHSPRFSEKLKQLDDEERHAKFLEILQAFKHETASEHVPTIVTSAQMAQGIGELMYDMVARATAEVPDEKLHMEDVQAPSAVIAPSTTTQITETQWLPPAEVPQGFFFDNSLSLSRKVPKNEKVRLAMMTEEEEAADAPHPLAGTPEMERFFHTLAEDFLQRNHAHVNPSVKPRAEAYFGMPLPTQLKMKYATPEEKDKWRQLIKSAETR
ncbi:putative GTP-binding protein EngB [Diplonema papillatum]|nr:putative GTP-binding protein EngB [Diplonema papillatum]